MQPEPITPTSAGMETPSQTVARVKQSIKPIKADVLGNTPAFVPPPKQNSQGALNRLEASVTPAPQATEAPAPVAPVAEPNLRDSLVQRQLAALEQLGTKGAKTQQIMEEQKVLEKQQALDAIDKEIAGRDNYYTRRLQTLEDKGGGLKIGYESEANTIRRDRARELADLQIIRAGKSQDVETARQYANDLIAAEFEPLKDELKYTGDLYNMLANDLTESEKLQVQDQMQTKRDATELAQSTSQAIYSELINAGAYTPEKGRLLQEAMAEASQAIKDGQSPDAAIAKMQSAMTGVQTMVQQQFQDQMLTSQAQRANIYDQINARQTALREAALAAKTEEEKVKVQAEADSEKALSIKTLAEDLLKEAGLSAAIGVGFKKSVIGSLPFVSGDAISGSARADFEAKASRLGNLLTLDNLKLMTGVLTDKDIEILRTAGSNLSNFNMSEAAYKEEVNRIVETMNRTISNNGITPEQATFWGVLEPNEVQTFNSIWDTL